MKTNISKIFIALTLVLVLTQCNDQLNIQPVNQIDSGESLKTSKDVNATLIGAYAKMGNANLYGGGFQVVADLLGSASDINFFGTFQGLTQIANKSIPINNDFVEGTWLDAYKTINSANLVLSALDVVDPVDRDRIEGEAKFIRGCMYFELVKLFGRAWNDGDPSVNLGVPLLLTPVSTLTDASKQPARATVSAVYAQVLSDLQDARNLLPPPESVTYYFATTGAASAMLSRVYMIQGDYSNAVDEADAVIQSGNYSLTKTFGDEFPYTGRAVRIFNTTEDIFASQVSEQSGTNAQNTYFASSDVGGRGDIEMYIDFLNLYDPADDRLKLFTDDGSGEYFYTNKFDNQYGNVKIIRLAEMYLTRAEANYQLDSSVGDAPENDINILRLRSNTWTYTSVGIAEILLERKLELACEGQWIWDYKRTNTDIALVPALSSLSPKCVFPVPQRELLVNPNLTQNEGY